MVWGLLEASVPFSGIGVTTPGQKRPSLERFWHVGGHPIPDGSSFAAGHAVFDFVDRVPAHARVLVLLSGGASACVEVATDTAAAIAATTQGVESGEDIAALNRRRARSSLFKAGGLGRRLLARGAQVRCWVLNDVGPGRERLVGSGPCDVQEIQHTSLADSSLIAAATAQMMESMGHRVEVWPRVEGPLEDAVASFLKDWDGTGCRVAAGEGDLAVPKDAAPGGRTSHAALTAAGILPTPTFFFAGASDGLDGTTGDAGAWAFPGDADAGALLERRAHAVLAAKNQTLRLGATGTNLNDVWIAAPNA